MTPRKNGKMNQIGLNHPDRMKAVSELTEEEKPKPCNTIDIDRFQQAYTLLKSVDRRVPPEIAKKAIHLISGARSLFQEIDLAAAYIVKLRVTKVALVFPLPDISRFSMPKPFQGIQHYTWALIHCTPTQSARNILLEGLFARQIGLSTKISASPTCAPLEHSILVVKSPRQTPLLKNGEKANKMCCLGLCIEGLWHTSATKLVAMKLHSCLLQTRHCNHVREVHDCP